MPIRKRVYLGKKLGEESTGALSPGAYLRAEILRLGLDQVAVSEATGVSRQTINSIINGRQAISRAMAGKLGRLLGNSSDYWLRRSFSDDTLTGGDGRPCNAGILVNHQIVHALKSGIIVIEPFDAANVRAASVDLTLDTVIVGAGRNAVDIRGSGFLLKAGRSLKVRCKERIGLPLDYIGHAGIISRLGDKGLVMSHPFQIEPGFEGQLQFSVFNAGGADFRLRAGDHIASIEVVRLGVSPGPG